MNGSVKNKKTTKNVLQISGFWSFILVTDMMQKTQQKKGQKSSSKLSELNTSQATNNIRLNSLFIKLKETTIGFSSK